MNKVEERTVNMFNKELSRYGLHRLVGALCKPGLYYSPRLDLIVYAKIVDMSLVLQYSNKKFITMSLIGIEGFRRNFIFIGKI